MSVINDMLRDLDKRQAPELGGVSGTKESIVEPQKKKTYVLVLLLGALIIIFLAVGWWRSSTPKTYEIVHAAPQSSVPAQSALDANQFVPNSDVSQQNASLDAETQKLGLSNTESSISSVVKHDTENSRPVSVPVKPEVEVQTQTKTNVIPPVDSQSDSKREISKDKAPAQIVQAPKNEESLPSNVLVEEIAPQESVQLIKNEPLRRVELIEPRKMDVSLSPAARDQQTADKASALFAQNQTADAYRELYAFIGNSDVNAESRTVLATYLLQEGRIPEAGDVLLNAPLEKYPELRQLKARWYAHQGEHQLAIYTLAADLPEINLYPNYFVLLGAYQQRYGSAEDAKSTYAKLVEYDETVADWWAGLGLASDRAKETEQAIFAYKQALELKGLSLELTNFVRPRLLQLEAIK